MADKTLKLEVITPEDVTLRAESTSVVVPGVDGELGIWPNHAPLLAGLKPGVISYKTASGTEKLVVLSILHTCGGSLAHIDIACLIDLMLDRVRNSKIYNILTNLLLAM